MCKDWLWSGLGVVVVDKFGVSPCCFWVQIGAKAKRGGVTRRICCLHLQLWGSIGGDLLDHICDADQVIKSSIINTEIQAIWFTTREPVCFMGRPNRDHLHVFMHQHGDKGIEQSEAFYPHQHPWTSLLPAKRRILIITIPREVSFLGCLFRKLTRHNPRRE